MSQYTGAEWKRVGPRGDYPTLVYTLSRHTLYKYY